MARYRNSKKGKTSKYRGVCLIRIGKNGNETWRTSYGGEYVGSYRTELEAAKAYDEEAYAFEGKDAKLNFPDEVK